MPRRCCVPGCKSNYDSSLKNEGPKSTFSFPKDEHLHKAWLRAIPRKDWSPTPYSSVCSEHFDSSEIIKFEEFVDSSGNKYRKQLTFPKLADGSVPHIFKNVPSYLSTQTSHRSDPDIRREKIVQRHEDDVNSFLASDAILNFDSFVCSFSEKLNLGKWSVKVINKCVIFYLLNVDCEPTITREVKVINSIIVSESMSVCVTLNGHELSANDLKWVLPTDLKLSMWSQIENLLARFVYVCTYESDFKYCIDKASSYLETAIRNADDSQENYLKLILDQFILLVSSRRQYSTYTLAFSFVIYSISPAAYNILRDFLLLPTKRRLQQLSAGFNISPNKEESNENYVTTLFKSLGEREQIVLLLIDEIHIKRRLSYKSQMITGYAVNNTKDLATSVQTLMLSSAFGSFREVVRLIPVNAMTGKELYDHVLQFITYVQNIGFKILCIITDNNRVNQNLFKLLSTNDFHFINPQHINEKVFLMFDPVHIFKNIRNCWLNLKDGEKTFVFPSDDDELKKACFSHLRDLHNEEKNNVIRKAFKLNNKSLYPNNLERQNVNLACNIFHDSTIAALSSKNDYKDTSEFVLIINKWWSVMNVKNTFKGTRKRDDFCTPVRAIDDQKVQWLRDFVDWLDKWNLNSDAVALTKDTYLAMRQSTLTVVDLIEYSFRNFSIDYFLIGKFQTDNLERRFSRYRSLSGCNYNVSYNQIVESEKKIRLQHLLRINDVKSLQPVSSDNERCDVDDFSCILSTDYLENCDLGESERVYVCGYAAMCVKKKLSCKLCFDLVVAGKGSFIGDTYFDLLQREGLCIPTDEVKYVLFHMCAIFQYIANNENLLQKFLVKHNHKQILNAVTLMSLLSNDFHVDLNFVCQNCGMNSYSLFSMVCGVLSNIILNNFTKLKNDTRPASNKRKLATLGYSK